MKNKLSLQSFLLGLSISALVLASAIGGAIADRLFVFKPLDYIFHQSQISSSKK
jgi:hypothetical protein